MRRLCVIMILLPLLLTAKASKNAWHCTLGTDFGYDANVFSLSDSDLDKFDAGNQGFSFMKSSDDMIVRPSLLTERTWKIGRIRWTPSLKGDYSLYMSNNDKSKWSCLAALEGEYRKLSVKAYYGYYPDNYVRNYNDQDSPGSPSRQYAYDKDLYKARAQYKILRHDTIALEGKYEVYRFNQYFTEYDGEATTLGLEWRHSFNAFSLTGSYDFRTCECDPASAEQGDASYDSDLLTFTLQNAKVKVARGRYVQPAFSFGMDNRYYQSDRQGDLAHANRHDRKYTLTAECAFYFMRHTDATLAFTKVRRNADSDYNSGISDTKDYTADQLWLRLRYDFSL
jgi:hypothetical protein